jgi:hypothetical protein
MNCSLLFSRSYRKAASTLKGTGGGGGSRTRVRKCYWSRAYMLSPVHAPGITLGRSRRTLRTDKKREPLACGLSLSSQT